jgi:hypothetical protein
VWDMTLCNMVDICFRNVGIYLRNPMTSLARRLTPVFHCQFLCAYTSTYVITSKSGSAIVVSEMNCDPAVLKYNA